MMAPICIGCETEMRCEQNGAEVRLSERWILACDVFRCPTCGAQIATGFARDPEQYRGQDVVADLFARGE
jgi:hypothetical protein